METPTNNSTIRSKPAASLWALALSFKLWRLWLKKVFSNISCRESACTILMAPIDSAAVAAIAPSRWRCWRTTWRIRFVRRIVENINRGNTAIAMSASSQCSQNMTAIIPTRVKE